MRLHQLFEELRQLSQAQQPDPLIELLQNHSPLTLHSLQEDSKSPVSCKGKKDWRGRPLLWNDTEQECRPVHRKLMAKLHSAQKASVSAITHSQQTQLGKESHETAAKSNDAARKAHEEAAGAFHQAGFATAGNAHLKQAVQHHSLRSTHLSKGKFKGADSEAKAPEKASEKAPEPSKPSTPAPAAPSAAPGAVTSRGNRDHRGRFARK